MDYRNCFLGEFIEGTVRNMERNGREDEDEDVRISWKTLRKKKNIMN
jgi:hypothetical protein